MPNPSPPLGETDETISGPLQIILECPQCGAPGVIDDETRSTRCAHCASFLVVDRPGREEMFLAESLVSEPEAVRQIVIAYRTESHRAEFISKHSAMLADGSRAEPFELLIESELARFRRELETKVRLSEAHRIAVPYWHLTGTILQGILGRQHDGPKQVRIRAFAVEQTVPGYDTMRANLRDRGLRLSRARIHPLKARNESETGAFLPRVRARDDARRDVEKWRMRDLDPGTEPVAKRGELVFVRRLLLYRPCWLARVVVSDEAASWVLVDAAFATLGGHPSELEARALLQDCAGNPEGVGDVARYAEAHAQPSRCPDCGYEQVFPPRTLVMVCTNCRLGLEPHASGIRTVAYDHEEAPSGGPPVYLPFWSFPLRLKVPGQAAMTTLEDYARALFPRDPPRDFEVQGDRLFVPAFSLLGTEEGDEGFRNVVSGIHARSRSAVPGKVPLGTEARFVDAVLTEDEARETLPFVLYALHQKPSAARLTTLLVRRLLDGVTIEPSPGRLIYLPFVPRESILVGPGPAVLRAALLERDSLVEARRVTVFRPSGAARA